MLTDTQIGMINHCLQLRINTLLHYYQNEGLELPCQAVFELLENTLSMPITNDDFKSNDISQYMGIGRPGEVDRIQKQLQGIFTPNFTILRKLKIIGNVRDTEVVTLEKFEEKSENFREKAVELANRILLRIPELEGQQLSAPRGTVIHAPN